MTIRVRQSHFLIEGPGAVKTLVDKWRADFETSQLRAIALLKELDLQEHTRSDETGVLTAVRFPKGATIDGWTKPDKRGLSRPKKGTEWFKRFKDQEPCPEFSPLFKKAFQIPTTMWPVDGQMKEHRVELGHWFRPCQLAWTQHRTLLIIPNVQYYVAESEAKGWTVPEDVKAFKPEFEGCRAISRDEWDILYIKDEHALKGEAA